MGEPAIHVLRSVFTRLVQQHLFASVATLRVLFFAYPTTTGSWFQTNPLEHELDDRADNMYLHCIFCVYYQWERYGTSAANLIKICHCIMVPSNQNSRPGWEWHWKTILKSRAKDQHFGFFKTRI